MKTIKLNDEIEIAGVLLPNNNVECMTHLIPVNMVVYRIIYITNDIDTALNYYQKFINKMMSDLQNKIKIHKEIDKKLNIII